MAPRVAGSIRSRREQLRRLAIVFKVELRPKIVTELFMREMSPKEFYEEFGGGSVSRVAQHFEALEEHGWLRRIGYKGRDVKRRGPSETLYRAPEPVFFDVGTWALLPFSARLAFSRSGFKKIAQWMREAIEASAFEGRLSREPTCTPLQLDSLGWTRVIKALDTQFEALFEEQEDARIRVARSGEGLIRAGVFLIGFESPRTDNRLAVGLADRCGEPPIPFAERLAPLFGDDLFMEILTQLNASEMSVKQFHRKFASDASEWVVRHRFERLKKLAWLAVVDKVKRRGAQEYIYRATKPAILDNGPWAAVPDALRETEAWATFEHMSDLVKEAIVAGSFDARDDRHLSWSFLSLDLEGWGNVVADLEALQILILEAEGQAKRRIESGAKPLTTIVALAAFDSPMEPVKAP
jgi:hypothetical protein